MLDLFRPPHLLSGMPPQTPILIALSGGADSVCLLDVLREYAAQYGTSLRLCHVNHGIRGEEAVRDRDFCVALAEQCGLPISVLDADIPALRAEQGGSVEEVARRVRYAYFTQVMEEYGIPLLATAHHADDQLETVLLRLTRGTGPDGLCGIPGVRPMGNGRMVIRPLLACERAKIEAYCTEQKLDYVIDATNGDIHYARNRIRHMVIPHLRVLNPAVAQAATRLCDAMRADCEMIAEQTEAFLAEALLVKTHPTGSVMTAIPCEKAGKLPEAVRRRVVIQMMVRVGCPSIEERFVRRLSELCVGEHELCLELPNGLQVSRVAGQEYVSLVLPGEIHVDCAGGWLYVSRYGHPAPAPQAVSIDLMALPQTVSFGGVCLTFSEMPPAFGKKMPENATCFENVYKMSMFTALNFDTIKGRVTVRIRQGGDVITCRGHHRKVKKLFCDLVVPREERDRLPILCDDDGILCIPGIGLRDGVSARQGDRALYIHVTPLSFDEYSSAIADQNISNQQKEETDEE